MSSMEIEEGRPLTEEPHGDVVWVKARDTLLGAAPKGREMDDGEPVEAEAALVLTAPWADDGRDGLIVIEGSYRRLLKTLDYARSALLGTAPALEATSEGATAALRCPHCGHLTWEDGEAGVTVVDYGERYTDLALRRPEPGTLVLAGDFGESIAGLQDHYECVRCERPVTLPEGITVGAA